MNKYQKKISTSAWRTKFLKKFEAINGIYETIDLANSEQLPKTIPYKLVVTDALNLIRSYPTNELSWARAFYNTRQLIAYWRWYYPLVEQWKQEHNIDPQFPVFKVSLENDSMKFNEVTIENIIADTNKYLLEKDINAINKFFSGLEKSPQRLQLFKSIIALDHVVRDGFEKTYPIFLKEEEQKKSGAWAYYRIHRILDTFLYVNKNGRIAGAGFSKIFFNSNLFNIMAFLFHKHTNDEKVNIDDVEEFLDRQRKYYARIAVKNSLAENEILNFCPHKHYYDADNGVIKIESTDSDLEYFQKNKIEAFNLKKLDGCPFAKSLGIETIAMMEVFKYFDKILVSFLQTNNLLADAFET